MRNAKSRINKAFFVVKIKYLLKIYGKIELPRNYLVNALGYTQYFQLLIERYMDLAILEEEHEEREHEIYLEYPEYYEDEGILDEMEQWVEDFLNAVPANKREYFSRLIRENTEY